MIQWCTCNVIKYQEFTFQVEGKVFRIINIMCFLGKTLFYTSQTIYRLFAHNTIHTHSIWHVSLSSSATDYDVPSRRAHVYIIYRPLSNHLRPGAFLLTSFLHHPFWPFFMPFSSYYDTPYPNLVIKFKARPPRWSFLCQNV